MADVQMVKIIMVGSMSVGKTSLITKYATGKKPEESKTTKNASYISKNKIYNKTNFEIKLWDTAGQEKYKSLTKLFTKEAKIAILVYSIDNEESFNDLNDWLKLVKASNDEHLILGVAANKSDLVSERAVSDERGKEYAKSIGAEWRSTSALLENEGIDELIDVLFKKYYDTNFNLEKTSSLSLTMEDGVYQKGGCCGGGKKVYPTQPSQK